MKAKINNDNKARFFALYWGQYVLREYGKHQINQYLVNHIYCYMPDHFLELKPLSQIGIPSIPDRTTIESLKPQDYDYLRSRGYALPWMGISVEEMIEAGWIKLMKG